MSDTRSRLTPKNKLFVAEYMANNMNGRRAYMTVYGIDNEEVADVSASRLLSKDKVKLYLEERMNKVLDDKEEIVSKVKQRLITAFNETKSSRDLDKLGRTLLELYGEIGSKAIKPNQTLNIASVVGDNRLKELLGEQVRKKPINVMERIEEQKYINSDNS
jgi:phage terminase small subunit